MGLLLALLMLNVKSDVWMENKNLLIHIVNGKFSRINGHSGRTLLTDQEREFFATCPEEMTFRGIQYKRIRARKFNLHNNAVRMVLLAYSPL